MDLFLSTTKCFCPFVIILFFSEGGRSEVGLEMFTEVSFRARDPYTTLRSKVCSQDHMIECHCDNVILMHGVECLRNRSQRTKQQSGSGLLDVLLVIFNDG